MAIEAQTAWWINFSSSEDLQLLFRDDYFTSLPFLCVGKGSNLLFVDNYKGIILHCINTDYEVIKETEEHSVIRVGAGMEWDALVERTLQDGLYGLENLSLIPGTVGACAVQNIGAYGAEACQFISSVEMVDMETGKFQSLSVDECNYAYRYSIFKESEHRSKIITHVLFRLNKKPQVNISYASLKQSFTPEEDITPFLIRKKVIEIRESKLPNPKELPNAGSFFMNPVVSKAEFDRLQNLYPDIPHYPAEKEDLTKLAAGWLIERCGLKGHRDGSVGVHAQQALVLVNYGGATGRDVVNFAEKVANAVWSKFGVKLKPEVLYVL